MLHGLRFVTTGGVSPANLADWLAEPTVAAVGGTWIADRAMIREGEWAVIRCNAGRRVRLANRVGRPG